MQSHPELQGCITHCVHCGIRFFTHPRNAGRRDLRCPFGCREHHRRQQSKERSSAYYRTAGGKRKKKLLNGRRSANSPAEEPRAAPVEQTSPRQPLPDDLFANVELRLEGVVLRESTLRNSPMLPYVQLVVSLIEGVELSRDELVGLLRQAMRQHSIAHRRRIEYLLGFLQQHPPQHPP